MFNWFYYTLRNLIHYRQERQISHAIYNQMRESESEEDIKWHLTRVALATVGLKPIKEDENDLPWYIPLSRLQKSWVDRVNGHGYKVGLL